jgi:hypothetical protein
MDIERIWRRCNGARHFAHGGGTRTAASRGATLAYHQARGAGYALTSKPTLSWQSLCDAKKPEFDTCRALCAVLQCHFNNS